nr:hypothetical protein BCU10_00430 [Vibrio splendidus]
MGDSWNETSHGKQQQFEYTYLFSFVCSARGIGEAIVTPWVNKDIMRNHREQISKATEKDRHAVIVMDGAGCHTNNITNQFDNISIIRTL